MAPRVSLLRTHGVQNQERTLCQWVGFGQHRQFSFARLQLHVMSIFTPATMVHQCFGDHCQYTLLRDFLLLLHAQNFFILR